MGLGQLGHELITDSLLKGDSKSRLTRTQPSFKTLNHVRMYALNTFDCAIFFFINEIILFHVANIPYIEHGIHEMNRGHKYY